MTSGWSRSVSFLSALALAAMIPIAVAAAGELFLLGSYHEVYRPDFVAEYGRLEVPNWNQPFQNTDPMVVVDVTPEGIRIGEQTSLDPEDGFYRSGLISSSFSVLGGFEAVVLVDVQEIGDNTDLVFTARMHVTNRERYTVDLGLAPGWAWTCWGMSFDYHTWDWRCEPGQSYVETGVHELRLQYRAEDRRLTTYVDLIPVAMFDLPVQSPFQVEGCALEIGAISRTESRFLVTVLDMLIGIDPVAGVP